MNEHDIRIKGLKLYFLPVKTRVPLKFGAAVTTTVICARTSVDVEKRDGTLAQGWGETPLSVQWVWPSDIPFETREQALCQFCQNIAEALSVWDAEGHAFELGHRFIHEKLPELTAQFSQQSGLELPYLAALVCFSLFDIALHDGYGQANRVPVYETYTAPYMNADLSAYLTDAEGRSDRFAGLYPADFLVKPERQELVAWHLVGGKDYLFESELPSDTKEDGYPHSLEKWLERDRLTCLKVKLTGNDAVWDYERMVLVGQLGLANGVVWLSADYNCQVTDCAYVNDMLDRLMLEHPDIYKSILYVEQPFPYDLHANPLDVRSVSARKPLFMDESAHDWEVVKLGRELGWSSVALKTCKTQTGALLSLCWAKAHGMTLMVQDLTNPMLAQIPHVLLAHYAGTIMGVETNAMQFYPEASSCEAVVHPGLYTRTDGKVKLDSLGGYGFGYKVEAIDRPLPEPAASYSR
ncbi:MAG: enolase superfamily enzyme related to L-alanine-DL-glutamate epimerase [Paenibacillus sp.]|jgi:L-alanine-DL-glutamate epimerase-like enolase superfamily enzyme|nr:enolase superfamily enzyme related to L-alanine-DL-glutamate epimerase [Paenibacillus sp.]